MRITPTTELITRFKNLQTWMNSEGLDAVLMAQNADLFYFTGSIQQGLLYIPATGEPLYLVRKDFGRARMESGLRNLVPLKSPRDLPGILAEFGCPMPETVGFELDVLPVGFFRRLEKILSPAQVVDATPIIRRVRAVKSDYELNIMKDAALIADKIHQRAAEVIREGITDLELAAELEFCARKEGHQGLVRMRGFNSEIHFGHAFSGTDSAVPTGSDTPLGGLGLNPSIAQGASYKKIAAGEAVMVDFVSCFDGYMVDQTRVFAVGSVEPKLAKAYTDMCAIQQLLLEQARPGATWGGLYSRCCEAAEEMGYLDHFMGATGAQVSFVGHGVGIELDEYPFLARGFDEQVLEPSMTFAFEPKAVFPGLGAVGIENTFWVAADGLKSLTFSDQQLRIV